MLRLPDLREEPGRKGAGPATAITGGPPANAVPRFLPDSSPARMAAALTVGPGAA